MQRKHARALASGDDHAESQTAKDMEHAPIKSYRDLTVWRKSVKLVVESYAVADRLPPHERYGLASQMRRAAVSVAANIAAGHGSSHRGTYLRHLTIARGSLRELECLIELASRLHRTAEATATRAPDLCDEVGRLLTALIRALSRKSSKPDLRGPDSG
jgi:four helix bundle protein